MDSGRLWDRPSLDGVIGVKLEGADRSSALRLRVCAVIDFFGGARNGFRRDIVRKVIGEDIKVKRNCYMSK
jgi:hypothetical protein